MGGLQPAGDWIRRALSSGKSVVTANKQLIARFGPELIGLARAANQQIHFGASVAGGVPVISGLHEGLAGDELFRIRGILNGTCNYILSQIEANGIPFANALREAQKLGFRRHRRTRCPRQTCHFGACRTALPCQPREHHGSYNFSHRLGRF